jgi:hypothetical protein
MVDRHDMRIDGQARARSKRPTTTIYIYSLYIWSLGLPITRGSPSPMVPSGPAALGEDGYKKTPDRLGLGFSRVVVPLGERAAVAVSSGVQAATIPGASGCGAPRRATSDDAPMADGQAPTALLNRTSSDGGGFLGRASGGNLRG